MEYKLAFLFKFLVVGELESLLSKQAPLEAYIEWLDSVVDRCVIKVSYIALSRAFTEMSHCVTTGK